MSPERLYHLLPAIYRERDAEQRGPLRALLQVIEREAAAIEDDIEGLYDNWFIETCADWVVPYIGDLLGVPQLIPTPSAGVSARAYVANTLAYRQGKGTPAVLQQLARDVTGWPARTVEYFQLLGTTQYINHLRPFNHRTPDLRDTNALELLGGPFECAAHTVDVRRIAPRLGKYNIPNIGVYVWRLRSYPVQRGDARVSGAPWCLTFNPLGLCAPLFNRPQTEALLSPIVAEIDVPAPLRRLPLFLELHARRKALLQNLPYNTAYFGDSPVFEVFLDGSPIPVDPAKIAICNLSEWCRPHAGLTVAVDPVLARLTLASGVTSTDVRVTYSYGFSADLGGGPYNRFDSVSNVLDGPVTWQRGISRDIAPVTDETVATLEKAIQAWNQEAPGTVGIIAILDSRTYDTGATPITIPAGSQLLIVGADWPVPKVPPGFATDREIGYFVPDGCRPHLRGKLEVIGATGGVLALNGLLVEGTVRVLDGDLARLRLSHCTLAPWTFDVDCTHAPGSGGLTVLAGNLGLEVTLDHVISGIVSLRSAVSQATFTDSIVDAAGIAGDAVDAPLSASSFERCTVLGAISAGKLDASNSIFTGRVLAGRRQEGCVRYSSLPPASRTARQFRSVTSQTPAFTSIYYGDPGYAQLSASVSVLIRTGAEGGSEMGVFCSLQEPQRKTNLQSSLDQYLRVGLDAGVYYAT